MLQIRAIYIATYADEWVNMLITISLPKLYKYNKVIAKRFLNQFLSIFIPVTRRVKGYTRFVGKYVTGRRKRFRLHKVYILLIRITSQVDLAMSVCPSVRMNAEISETIRARLLRFGVQIPELHTQRMFVSVECQAHSNAHKPPKTVAPTVLMLE